LAGDQAGLPDEDLIVTSRGAGGKSNIPGGTLAIAGGKEG
jgi:hypothetical protein